MKMCKIEKDFRVKHLEFTVTLPKEFYIADIMIRAQGGAVG